MLTLVTGGSRSGKSRYAQQQAERQSGPLLYVATAEIGDAEMAERVALHRAARGDRWQTLEEALRLSERLPSACAGYGGVVVDCVTLWLSTLYFHHDEQAEPVLAQVDTLLQGLAGVATPVWLVSNELGSGIVPENPLARRFRDLAGSVNQRLAAAADAAWLVVAGLPLQLK